MTFDYNDHAAKVNDRCFYQACHIKGQANALSLQSLIPLEGNQNRMVTDGAECRHESDPAGIRTGQCFGMKCILPESLAEVPICGNGGLDFGEECDCGAAISKTGCDCSTCTLLRNYQCDPSEACCGNNGKFLARGTVCRAAADSECDIAETCTGSSAKCPFDVQRPITTTCRNGKSNCYGGICVENWPSSCGRKSACVNGGWQSTVQITGTISYSVQLRAGNCIAPQGMTVGGVKCIDGFGTSILRNTNCNGNQYFAAGLGACVTCSEACNGCTGPTAHDCKSCKFGGADCRGQCAISNSQFTNAGVIGQCQNGPARMVQMITTSNETLTEMPMDFEDADSSEQTNPSDGFPTWAIVAIAVVSSLFALLGCAFCLRKRKQPKEDTYVTMVEV